MATSKWIYYTMNNIHQQPYLFAVYHSTAAHRAATKPPQPCLSPPILVPFLQFCAMSFLGAVYSVLPLIAQCIANSQQPQRLNITCSCSDGELFCRSSVMTQAFIFSVLAWKLNFLTTTVCKRCCLLTTNVAICRPFLSLFPYGFPPFLLHQWKRNFLLVKNNVVACVTAASFFPGRGDCNTGYNIRVLTRKFHFY